MKKIVRLFALLLVVAMVVSLAASAFAAEEDDMSAYIFDYNVPDNGYTGPRYQYFSPYVVDYIYDETPSYIQNYIFSLYNTITGEVIPVYCTDITVGAYTNHHYRQQNLEDSTYAASSAELLRAILFNGFYLEAIDGESEEDHAVRVEQKLAQLGAAAGVEDLTIGEAIAATQTAIWQAAHGARLSFPDLVRTIYTYKQSNMTKHYDICNEERENGHINYTVSSYGTVTLDAECDAWLNERIKTVHDYLLALDPIPPMAKVVSTAAFRYTAVSGPVANDDGTFNITARATVDVDMNEGDSLILSADVADAYSTSAALHDGQQDVELTIENVPADVAFDDVELTIEGEQSVSEAFLYDAYGEREAAQSMIGLHSGRTRVRASVIADPTERVLNFHKTTNDGQTPLEGITFDIYPVATMDEYLSGEVVLPEPEDYEYPAVANYTVITDINGDASMNFSKHGLPDGVYLVVEREHPAIVAPVAPFYVVIPMTNADGTGQDYVINIHPKNEVKGNINIEKDVDELGNNKTSVGIYVDQTWIIGATIPDDIANGKQYLITDDLDNRLDYIGNMSVHVESVYGEERLVTLTEGTHYTVTVHDYDSLSEGKPHDSFEMSLTKEGMQAVAASLGDKNFADYMLRVYFIAQINANGLMNEEIPNEAVIEYINSVNFKFIAVSDRPVVNMGGGVELVKVDATNHEQTLSGAQFQLFREATPQEVAAGVELVRLEGVLSPLVQVTFFTNREWEGTKQTHATTGEDGKAGFYGLAYGEYYLLETKAPDGYNLTNEPIKIVIDENSLAEENAIVVENTAGVMLPETGGIGTTVFTVFGIALMGVSFLLLISKKKRSDCE